MPSGVLAQRLKDIAAMALVGDGVLALLMPNQRMRVWYRGPGWWETAIGALLKRPNLVRVLAVAEAGVGIWLANRERAQ